MDRRAALVAFTAGKKHGRPTRLVPTRPDSLLRNALDTDDDEFFHLYAAASMAAKSALAITIPSQASSGGLGRGSGIAFSSTEASMSGYTLEGTKKKGLSVKQKRSTLANARAEAEAASTSANKAAEPAPAKKK